MKKIITISSFILFTIVCNAAFAQDGSGGIKTIIDSLEVLKNAGGLVDGYTNPVTQEEARYYGISKMLWGLPFSEAKKLITDKNKFARVYGFSVSVKRYFDSLKTSDLSIFSDTSNLPLYTQRGIIDEGMTVGQYCKMAYMSTIEERKVESKQADVIAAIRRFIKSNATFSKSYESIEFSDYAWGGDGEYAFYVIRHRYKLKDNNGNILENTDYFTLNENFDIMLIEKERSGLISVDPPATDEWLKVYGKK